MSKQLKLKNALLKEEVDAKSFLQKNFKVIGDLVDDCQEDIRLKLPMQERDTTVILKSMAMYIQSLLKYRD